MSKMYSVLNRMYLLRNGLTMWAGLRLKKYDIRYLQFYNLKLDQENIPLIIYNFFVLISLFTRIFLSHIFNNEEQELLGQK